MWIDQIQLPSSLAKLLCGLCVFGAIGLMGLEEVQAQLEERVTIYRDEFGTPHIFASSEEGVCFGHGYAQADDRLDELLKQYLRCTGTMSATFGPEFLQDDYRQRLWRHAEIAQARYGELDPKSRKLIEAYQAGIRHYLKTHPSQVPDWAPDIQPWMVVALSRYILWGWPEGEAADDLGRIGIQADPVEYRGSNQWLIAPSRTADGVPLALIDPHLSWYGAFRFYEVRLYGGSIEFSGVSLLGMPLPLLGHNRYCSIAMTTGGPDTSDVYEEVIHPNDHRLYQYEGQWVPMQVREEVIEVLQGTERIQKKVTLDYTRHGPVVARRDGKAYVFAIPYDDQIGMADQTYRMVIAKNLKEMQDALGMLQLMMQNIMIGTVDGDIYYVRNGRVPIRPEGYDHKKPVPGNFSKNEWKGIHPLEDLIQMHNPPQGYMQNCNISPQFMTKDCPLKPDPKRAYLFNGYQSETQAYDKPLHQRARSCLMQLEEMKQVTVEEAIELALSPLVSGAAEWQTRLREAWSKAPDTLRDRKEVKQMVELILHWNRRCDIDATGAIAYKYWKSAFGEEMKQWDRLGKLPSEQHHDELIMQKIQEAIPKLLADHGRLDVRYGDVYRVGRKGSNRTWPVAGGNNDHIATPRAIGFDPIPGTKQFLGKSGQTSPQVVQLSRPPKSWSVLPLGESDDPTSPHFDDQAEKLFGPGKMKPTYFLDKETLLQHIQSQVVLLRQP